MLIYGGLQFAGHSTVLPMRKRVKARFLSRFFLLADAVEKRSHRITTVGAGCILHYQKPKGMSFSWAQ